MEKSYYQNFFFISFNLKKLFKKIKYSRIVMEESKKNM